MLLRLMGTQHPYVSQQKGPSWAFIFTESRFIDPLGRLLARCPSVRCSLPAGIVQLQILGGDLTTAVGRQTRVPHPLRDDDARGCLASTYRVASYRPYPTGVPYRDAISPPSDRYPTPVPYRPSSRCPPTPFRLHVVTVPDRFTGRSRRVVAVPTL